ncbi:MAG: SUMF1/EgtB/PvdO family nonheme iron enzyme [Rhodothermales bacterium]
MMRIATTLALAMLLAGCATLRHRKPSMPLDFVRIPAGEFRMGDIFEGENEDAIPVHTVAVDAFELARVETTYAQYDAFAAATDRPLPDDAGYGRGLRAVVNVSWYDARDFCAYYGYRLPTEAEWEYAARGGGLPRRFAGADSVDGVGRWLKNSVMHSFPAGSKMPNELGLLDMSGNVYEWIGAYYEAYPDSGQSPVFKDLDQFAMRILRGGSFKSEARLTQTFWRSGTLADVTSDNIGFRCAR